MLGDELPATPLPLPPYELDVSSDEETDSVQRLSREEIIKKCITNDLRIGELPKLIVVMQSSPEVCVMFFDEHLEADGRTPVSSLRYLISSGLRISSPPYADQRLVECFRVGQYKFSGIYGEILNEKIAFDLHSWGRSHWLCSYDLLAGVPKECLGSLYPAISRKLKPFQRGGKRHSRIGPVRYPSFLFATVDNEKVYYALRDDMFTTDVSGRHPIHRAAEQRDFAAALSITNMCSPSQRFVLWNSVTLSGKTALDIALSNPIVSSDFLTSVFTIDIIRQSIRQDNLKKYLKIVVRSGLISTITKLVETTGLFDLIMNGEKLSPEDALGSCSAQVVRLIGNKTDWFGILCLDWALRRSNVSVDLLKEMLSYPDVKKNIRSKASWKSIGSHLVTEGRLDILKFLLEHSDTSSILRRHARDLVHLSIVYQYDGIYCAGGVRYKDYNPGILELLLRYDCYLGPVRTKHHAKDIKLSALAVAMDTGSQEAVEKILKKYSKAEFNSAVSIMHGPDRVVVALPMLAYAMGLGDLGIVNQIINHCEKIDISPLTHPVRRLTSDPPWETCRVMFEVENVEVFPEDIWGVILQYCGPRCLARIEMVSRSIHDVVCSGDFWKSALIDIKKKAEATSPQYARIKGRGINPLPDMDVTNPKHVVGHAIDFGIFLRNCRCLNIVEPTTLASSHQIKGFRTRSSINVSGYSCPLVRSRLLERHIRRNKICCRSKSDEIECILKTLSLELKQNVLGNDLLHSVAMSFSRDDNGHYLSYVIHPLIRAVQLLDINIPDEQNISRIIQMLETLQPGNRYGDFTIADAHDEPLPSEHDLVETVSFNTSLLGVAISHSSDEKLLEIVWKLTKDNFISNPQRYSDIAMPLIDYCVSRNNLNAVKLFFNNAEQISSRTLLIGIRRACPVILDIIIEELSKNKIITIDKQILCAALSRSDSCALRIASTFNAISSVIDLAVDHAAWRSRIEYIKSIPTSIKIDPVFKKRILTAAIGSGHLSTFNHLLSIQTVSDCDYVITDDETDTESDSTSKDEDYFVFSARNAHSRRFDDDPPGTIPKSKLLLYDARRLDQVDCRCSLVFELNDTNRINQYLLPGRTLEQLPCSVVPPLFIDQERFCGNLTKTITTSEVFSALGCKSGWDDRDQYLESSRTGRYQSGMWHAAHLSDIQLRKAAIGRHVIVSRVMRINNLSLPLVCRVHFGTLDTKHIQLVLTADTYEKVKQEGDDSPTLLHHVDEVKRTFGVKPLFWVFTAPKSFSESEPDIVDYEIVCTAVSPSPSRFVKVRPEDCRIHSKEIFYQNSLDSDSRDRCLLLIPPRRPTDLRGRLVGSEEQALSKYTFPVIISLPTLEAFPVPNRRSDDLRE